MKKTLRFLSLLVIIALNSYYAKAIPAFSRKYHTSCATCHTIFPKLNPYGEAFRINGYQLPKDDEFKLKEEPISMGSEANKRVFPKAIWPSSIPGSVPISLRARTSYQLNTVKGVTSGEFGLPALQILGAGTFGRGVTLFAGAHLFENGDPGSIDALYLKFNSVFRKVLPEKLLYIKIGQFIPEIVPFATHHRGLTETPYGFNTWDPSMGDEFLHGHVHGAGPFGIENFQLGLEVSGVVAKRLRYVVGLVNGSGTKVDINAAKDYYGRLAYKFGGMGYDGSIKDSAEAGLETSFAIGAFGYFGTGTDDWTLKDYAFDRIGGDFNLSIKKLNIIGGYIRGNNKIDNTLNYHLYFMEASYMFYPWLTGLVRYESALPDHGKTICQIIPHISALVVSNVKIKLETRLDPNDMKSVNIFMGVDFAL